MKYFEGDEVLIVDGDFEGNIGVIDRYEEVFERYIVLLDDIMVGAKEWELELMPEDTLKYDDEYENYRFRITVITPESFNEFTTDIPHGVSVTDFGMLQVHVIQNGMQTETKAFAPGQWCTVHTKVEEIA